MSIMTSIGTANRRDGEGGMVSMITTIIVGILLVIIVTSMTSLMIGELRQSADADQSIRAYYAAEAGVEDAILKIKKALPGRVAGHGPACQPAVSIGQVTYTCQRIMYDTNILTGTLAKEQPLQIDLSTASPPNVRRIEVSWNTDNDAPVPFPAIGAGEFPPGGSWGARPAVMELSLASYPDNPSFSLSQINFQTTILKPQNSAGGASVSNIADAGPIDVDCAASRPYRCMAIIQGLDPTRNYVMRLKPRYAATHYQVQAFNCSLPASCPASDVPDQFATIDVTARAGDVYRRVVVKMPVVAGVHNVDYVLWSDTDICKNFKVRESLNQAQAEIGCGINTFD